MIRTKWLWNFSIVAGLLLIGAPAQVRAQDSAVQDAPPKNPAITEKAPQRPLVSRNNSINERAKQGDVDLLFIGDSITHFWDSLANATSRPTGGGGKDVWEKYYGNRKAMNAGVSGDQTGHVLYRLNHGNIDGIHPKLAVVMIGTNNAPDAAKQTGEQIAEGVTAIVKTLREKLPDTKILLLAVFPRNDKSSEENESMRQKLTKVNFVESKLADDKIIFFLDLSSKFVDADGKLPKETFPDGLHPNVKGYEIWAQAMEPKIAELMSEKK